MRWITVKDSEGNQLAVITETQTGYSISGENKRFIHDIIKTWRKLAPVEFEDIPARGSYLSRVIFGRVEDNNKTK